MVLTDPQLVEPEPVEVLGQVEVAAELQRGVLTDRVMGCEERAELQPGHHGAELYETEAFVARS
jgi:hypothetical protein